MRRAHTFAAVAASLVLSSVAFASPGDRVTITDPSDLAYFAGTYEMTYCRFCCNGDPVADAVSTFGMDAYGRWVFDDSYGCAGNPYGGGGGGAQPWGNGDWNYSFEVEETQTGLFINLTTGGQVENTYFRRGMTMPTQVMQSGSNVPSGPSYDGGGCYWLATGVCASCSLGSDAWCEPCPCQCRSGRVCQPGGQIETCCD